MKTPARKIRLSTLENLSGQVITECGLISVSIVQSAGFFKSLGAEIRSQTIGGRSNSMSELMEHSRENLLKGLQDCAYKVGADAVIGIRFTSGEVLAHGFELMAYGTAVKITSVNS